MTKIEKLKKLCDAATPGPWENKHGNCVWREPFLNEDGLRTHQPICDANVPAFLTDAQKTANANCIAASREALPWALEMIERMKVFALGKSLTPCVFEKNTPGRPCGSCDPCLARALLAELEKEGG